MSDKSIAIHTQYAHCGRNISKNIIDGKLILTKTKKGSTYESETHIIRGGEITEAIYRASDGRREHIKYGIGATEYDRTGKIINDIKYRVGSNQAVMYASTCAKTNGKARIGNLTGVVEHFEKYGGLKREKFTYNNGQVAYDISYTKKHHKFYRPNGTLWVETINMPFSFGWANTVFAMPINNDDACVRYRRDDNHAVPLFIPLADKDDRKDSKYNFEQIANSRLNCKRNWAFKIYGRKGKSVVACGQWTGGQKSGIWLEHGKKMYYMMGVKVNKKMYDGEIDVNYAVTHDNVQFRSAMIQKLGTEKILKHYGEKATVLDEIKDTEGKVEYSLITIPTGRTNGDTELKLLKVRCPSSGAYYTLAVPPNVKDCMTARQWTFGADVNRDGEINAVEQAMQFIRET